VEQETVTVEEPPEPPKPRPARRSPRKKNSVTPEHVEALTVQVFALTAMLKNAPHWMVQDRKEMAGWSGPAADLLNEYLPKDTVEKAIGLNAGVAVVVGIGMMVFNRMQIDQQLKAQKIAANRPAQPEPGKPSHPQEPKRQPEPVQMQERRRHTPTAGGGAAPTRPAEPLVGLGVNAGGLT